LFVSLSLWRRALGEARDIRKVWRGCLSHCPYQRDDFIGIRKVSALALGKDLSAVYRDVENTVGTGYQFNVGVQFFFEFVSQPGSPWTIVSLCTVLDADLHYSISGCCRCLFA
jgi:hypothetical protein